MKKSKDLCAYKYNYYFTFYNNIVVFYNNIVFYRIILRILSYCRHYLEKDHSCNRLIVRGKILVLDSLPMAKCLVGKDVTCVITNNESLPEQLGISVFTGGKSFVLPFNQHILHAKNDQ